MTNLIEAPVCEGTRERVASPEVTRLIEHATARRARARSIASHPVMRQVVAIVRTVHNTADSLSDLLGSHGMSCRCRFCVFKRKDDYYAEDWWKDFALLLHAMINLGGMVETNLPSGALYHDDEE